MATFTEETEYDKIEVVSRFKHLQVKKSNIIKKDGKVISRSFERYSLNPDSDMTGQPAEIVAISNAVWTQEVKDAWKAHQESLSLR
tara:strand:- start:85 stop:342 length:258 start_codon:yes stop_codon:yes gene_type:complete